MTKYVGEGFRITSGPLKGYRGETLTEADVESVTILILNKDRTVLVDEEEMTWVEDETLWEYTWDADGLETGTYRYRITLVGDNGLPSVEWFQVRLAKQQRIEA